MMREEFEQRTGYFPTMEEYKIIERHYLAFSGDKDIFCNAYKKNEEWIAQKIQQEADMEAIKEKVWVEHLIEGYEAKIAKLNAALEKEQEWKPYEDKDHVSEEDYQALAHCSDTKIIILHSVPRYEKNRHSCLRKIGERERLPLYNATDWNYIRFNCGCMSYELYNDSLRLYVD